MTKKRYSEMDNVELTGEAKRVAYLRKKAGETHYNLLYALAFRIEELTGQEAPEATATPVRCRTVEEVEEQRGLSREARAYIRRRDGVFAPSRIQTPSVRMVRGGAA